MPDEHLTGVWQPARSEFVHGQCRDGAAPEAGRLECPATAPPHGPPADGAADLECHERQAVCLQPPKRSHRTLIDDYIRTVANATIALEFDTTPQKYILGVTDEQYDVLISDKFKSYVGSLLAATSNPETGETRCSGSWRRAA